MGESRIWRVLTPRGKEVWESAKSAGLGESRVWGSSESGVVPDLRESPKSGGLAPGPWGSPGSGHWWSPRSGGVPDLGIMSGGLGESRIWAVLEVRMSGKVPDLGESRVRRSSRI